MKMRFLWDRRPVAKCCPRVRNFIYKIKGGSIEAPSSNNPYPHTPSRPPPPPRHRLPHRARRLRRPRPRRRHCRRQPPRRRGPRPHRPVAVGQNPTTTPKPHHSRLRRRGFTGGSRPLISASPPFGEVRASDGEERVRRVVRGPVERVDGLVGGEEHGDRAGGREGFGQERGQRRWRCGMIFFFFRFCFWGLILLYDIDSANCLLFL